MLIVRPLLRLIIITSVLSCQQPARADSSQEQSLPNIIIVTLSGVRRIESIDDPQHRLMPFFWKEMVGRGVLYSDLVDDNLEFHMTVMQAINTGNNQYNYKNIETPTVFQYLRRQYHWPASKVWSIGHWFNDVCLLESGEWDKSTFPGLLGGSSFEVSSDLKKILNKEELLFLAAYKVLRSKEVTYWTSWGAAGRVHFKFFMKILQRYHPKFVHYEMNDPEVAHYDTYGSYINSLKASDEMLFQIWQRIEEDPFYKGNTFMFVSVEGSN